MLTRLQARPAPVDETSTRTALSGVWHVVVLNDPVNTMPYVVMVFRKIFGYPLEKARRHMLEVHQQGRSILWTGERERAEAYAHSLHEWQLTAVLERNGQD